MNENIDDSERVATDCETAQIREREITLSDGRYLIFYTFDEPEPDRIDV